MGTRVNYEIVGDQGAGTILYVNNSHEAVDPDRMFIDALMGHATISGAVASLLLATYPAGGNHLPGSPIFTIDLFPDDREYVLRAKVGAMFEGSPIEPLVFERDNLDGTLEVVDPPSAGRGARMSKSRDNAT